MELIERKITPEKLTDKQIKTVISEYVADILWDSDTTEYMDLIKIEYFKRGLNSFKLSFNKGDRCFDIEHNCYCIVLDNYGDDITGDGGEVRTDANGNVNIFTFNKDWSVKGYNLIKINK